MEAFGIIIAVGAALTAMFALGALWAIRVSVDRHRTLTACAEQALREEFVHLSTTTAAGLQGLRSNHEGLRLATETLRHELVSIGEEARQARVRAIHLEGRMANLGALTPPAPPVLAAGAGGAAALPPAAPRPRSADDDGEVTLFLERAPANDRATDYPPITPTKLSPTSASPSPKA